MRTSTGISTEAVYIFNNMVRKLASGLPARVHRGRFSKSGKTFREEPSSPSTKPIARKCRPICGEQIPYIRAIAGSDAHSHAAVRGFRGRRRDRRAWPSAAPKRLEVVIVSSDKDMLQLVNERVHMLNPVKEDIWYDPANVKEFMGVKPAQVADLLALKGDAIDNIPGAPGIGDKGARDLIVRFGSVEAAIEHAAEVERKTYRESLQNNREQILMSKRLATIDTTVPIEFELEIAARAGAGYWRSSKKVYKELEFYSLLKELGPHRGRAHARLLGRIASREEAMRMRWPGETRPAQPMAFAIRIRPGRRFAAHDAWACRYEGGDGARAVRCDYLDRAEAVLEDAARSKIAHDVKV